MFVDPTSVSHLAKHFDELIGDFAQHQFGRREQFDCIKFKIVENFGNLLIV